MSKPASKTYHGNRFNCLFMLCCLKLYPRVQFTLMRKFRMMKKLRKIHQIPSNTEPQWKCVWKLSVVSVWMLHTFSPVSLNAMVTQHHQPLLPPQSLTASCGCQGKRHGDHGMGRGARRDAPPWLGRVTWYSTIRHHGNLATMLSIQQHGPNCMRSWRGATTGLLLSGGGAARC